MNNSKYEMQDILSSINATGLFNPNSLKAEINGSISESK